MGVGGIERKVGGDVVCFMVVEAVLMLMVSVESGTVCIRCVKVFVEVCVVFIVMTGRPARCTLPILLATLLQCAG